MLQSTLKPLHSLQERELKLMDLDRVHSEEIQELRTGLEQSMAGILIT